MISGQLTPQSLTAILHELCDLAERETMPRFRLGIGVENKDKAAFDPVTQADHAAEAAIRDWLGKHLPAHGIVGEEAGPSNPDAEFVWHIDPVDGTRAFICGLPSWGTLIGLAQHGRIIAGVMAQPFTGERYLAAGAGAWLRHGECNQPLTTRATQDLSTAMMMSTSPYLFAAGDIDRYRELEKRCRMTRYGFDCYAYAMLASGHIDLVVESGLKSYDVAALIAIIEQAGGRITDWDGNNALPGGRILAAANPNLHGEAMKVLART
jgi:histidinol phosphatase-like enzyme (inositol monophosphatase family)